MRETWIINAVTGEIEVVHHEPVTFPRWSHVEGRWLGNDEPPCPCNSSPDCAGYEESLAAIPPMTEEEREKSIADWLS